MFDRKEIYGTYFYAISATRAERKSIGSISISLIISIGEKTPEGIESYWKLSGNTSFATRFGQRFFLTSQFFVLPVICKDGVVQELENSQLESAQRSIYSRIKCVRWQF